MGTYVNAIQSVAFCFVTFYTFYTVLLLNPAVMLCIKSQSFHLSNVHAIISVCALVVRACVLPFLAGVRKQPLQLRRLFCLPSPDKIHQLLPVSCFCSSDRELLFGLALKVLCIVKLEAGRLRPTKTTNIRQTKKNVPC